MSGVSDWIVASAIPVAILAALALLVDAAGARLPLTLRAAPWLAVLARACLPPGAERVIPASLPALSGARLESGASASSVVFLVWLAGVAVLASATALAHRRRLARWRVDATRELSADLAALIARCVERSGLRRAPRVLLAPRAPSPLVHGVFRPELLLPASFPVEHPIARVEHVILHELAHVRHRDPLAAALTLGAAIACWWHPAAWLAAARLARLREFRADREAAVRSAGGAPDYRRTLLEHARSLLGWRTLSTSTPGLSSSSLVQRLRLLERPCSPARAWERPLAALVVALLVVLTRAAAGSVPATAAGTDDPDREAGCLHRRFVVLASLHRAEQAADLPTPLQEMKNP